MTPSTAAPANDTIDGGGDIDTVAGYGAGHLEIRNKVGRHQR